MAEPHLGLLENTWQTRHAGSSERVHQVADLVLLPARLGAHPLVELNLPLGQFLERSKGNGSESVVCRLLDERVERLAGAGEEGEGRREK